MVQKWLISLAVSFVLKQLAKWQQGIKWDLVKADLEARLRALVPGEMFDDELVQALHALVDILASILAAQADLELIINLAVAGKFAEAVEALKDLVLKHFIPQSEVEKQVVKCIECL